MDLFVGFVPVGFVPVGFVRWIDSDTYRMTRIIEEPWNAIGSVCVSSNRIRAVLLRNC